MEVRSPRTDAEFERYYELRWQVLRAPWGEPRGSERDEFDEAAEHAFVQTDEGEALATGRLHFNSPEESQIRYMAVADRARGQGLGHRIVEHLRRSPAGAGRRRLCSMRAKQWLGSTRPWVMK